MPNFTVPDFSPPAQTNPGDTFDALGTFTLNKDGSLTLTAVEGVTISGYEKESESADDTAEEADEESQPGFMDRYQQGMSEKQPPMPMG